MIPLIWALRGLVHATEEDTPADWQRFLDIHLAGLRAAGPTAGDRYADMTPLNR